MRRVLEPRVGAPKVKELYALDLETVGPTNDFYMGSVVGEGGEFVSYNQLDIIDYLVSRTDRDALFFATNLQFDVCALLRDTDEYSRLSPTPRGGKFIAAEYHQGWETRYHKGEARLTKTNLVRFRETLAFFPFSVADLGRNIAGIHKLPSPACLGRLPETEEERAELERYNVRDSTITLRTMQAFQRFINELGGELKMTLASTAFDLWLRRFLDRDLYQAPKDIIDFIYKGYYGGRVECFRAGVLEGPGYVQYDINSLYPYVMRSAYPDPNSYREATDPSVEYIERYMGMSDVTVTVPATVHKPVLPYRAEKGAKLLFPTGTFRGVWTHIELLRAMRQGATIDKVHRTVYYTEQWYPFREYVDMLYEMRLRFQAEGNKAKEVMCKTMMNSLYGRMAMDVLKNTEMIHVDDLTVERYDELLADGYVDRRVGPDEEWCYFEKKVIDEYPPNIVPILAAYCTAYARIELLDLIEDDPTAIYSDTDSLITARRHPASNDLGALKVDAVIVAGCFVQPKVYSLQVIPQHKLGILFVEDKVRAKGIRLRSHDELVAILRDGGGVSTTRRFTSFRQSNVMTHGRYRLVNEVVELSRSVGVTDTKRQWLGTVGIHGLTESIPRSIVAPSTEDAEQNFINMSASPLADGDVGRIDDGRGFSHREPMYRDNPQDAERTIRPPDGAA